MIDYLMHSEGVRRVAMVTTVLLTFAYWSWLLVTTSPEGTPALIALCLAVLCTGVSVVLLIVACGTLRWIVDGFMEDNRQ